MLEAAQYLLVSFLPGSWLCFAPRLGRWRFDERLVFAFCLSPLIVFLQFYLLRLIGLDFGRSAYAILLLNLPAAYFVARHASLPSRETVLRAIGFLLVVAVPMVFLVIKFFDIQLVAYTGHGWIHTDVMYSLANGYLSPDDAEMASAAQTYPWMGNLYHAILAYLIDRPPIAVYHVSNVFWLIALSIFLVKIVKSLGGGRFAQLTSILWLCFGVNVVGYLLTVKPLDSIEWFRSSGIWGHDAYSPWLEKYFFFSFMPIGLGLFGAAAFLMLSESQEAPGRRYRHCVIGLLAISLSLAYPILSPALLGLLGAYFLVTLFDRGMAAPEKRIRLAEIVVVTIVSTLVTFAYITLLATDRVDSTVTLSALDYNALKTGRALIVLSPLLIGLAIAFRFTASRNRRGVLLLSLAALASAFLHSVFSLAGGDNEYKYIFTAAICLSAFPAIAMQELFAGRERWRSAGFVVVSLVLVAPMAHKMHFKGWGSRYPVPGERPELDLGSFDLKLAASQAGREMYETIRLETPPDSMLIVLESDIHIPTLTQRSLYISPYRQDSRVGVSMPVDRILKEVKGFDPELVAERRARVAELYSSRSAAAFAQNVARIQDIDRPLVVLMDENDDADLIRVARESGLGNELYSGGSTTVWFIPASAARS